MQAALDQISNSSLRQNLPDFQIGQTVRVHQRIKEGEKTRIQVFEGLIIKMNGGKGIGGTICVRKVVDGIGVERIFPIHSANIAKIEVTKQAKVRRSKLYYLRSRTGKSARLKTTLLEGQVFEPKSNGEIEAEAAEAKAAEEAAKAEAEAAKAAEAEAAKAEAEAPAEEAPATEEVPAAEAEAPAEEEKSE